MARKTRMVVKVDSAQLVRLDSLAQTQMLSRSEVVRQATRWWLDWHDQNPTPPAPLT